MVLYTDISLKQGGHTLRLRPYFLDEGVKGCKMIPLNLLQCVFILRPKEDSNRFMAIFSQYDEIFIMSLIFFCPREMLVRRLR